jgi:hypothetical protein
MKMHFSIRRYVLALVVLVFISEGKKIMIEKAHGFSSLPNANFLCHIIVLNVILNKLINFPFDS